MAEKNPGNSRRKRALLLGLCVILAVMLTGALAVTAYANHLLDRIRYVDPDTVVPLTQEELDALQREETEPAAAVTASPAVLAASDEVAVQKDVVNILLIGQDRRGSKGRARSDAMVLCTFDPGAKRLTMTSFLRDLWVEIPGYRDNKINAAYTAGGMKLLRQTLSQNFGVEVDGCIEVDFSQFARIIDLLGGVELELRADEARYINRNLGHGDLQQGLQTLNGEQALWFSRIRALDADADFSRTERQRKVIGALLDKYSSVSFPVAMGMLEKILPMVTTDMSRAELMGYVVRLLPMMDEVTVKSQRIPADGTYTTPRIRGMAVVLADMEAARRLLRETMGEEEIINAKPTAFCCGFFCGLWQITGKIYLLYYS